MSFNAALGDMDDSIFDALGVSATYNVVTPCSIVIDRNVQRVDSYGEVLSGHTEISVLKALTGEISKGDIFIADSETLTVSRVLSDDGSIIIAMVT